MKILLIQHKRFLNGSGGVEKICTFLANGFTELGHKVEIATNDPIDGTPFFSLNTGVTVTNIHTPHLIEKKTKKYQNYRGGNPFLWIKHKAIKKYAKLLNNRLYKRMGGKEAVYAFNLQQRAKAWKQYIDTIRPEIIITMSIDALLEITYENIYDNISIINSTNGRPDYDYTDILWYRSSFEQECLKNCYKQLSGTQLLFESYKNYLPDTFKGVCAVISNPAPVIKENNTINHLIKKPRYKIVQIASFNIYHKQQDISINIFSALANKYPCWDLLFWGEGPDEMILREKIAKAGLQERIFLMGLTNNPIDKLKESDIFIFPSRFEGFPLALIEAMSVGLPSLGFKSCSGVNELIKHNENGYLANDTPEMLVYLEKLIENAETRQLLGKNAHYAMAAYKPKIIIDKWNTFVNQVLKENFTTSNISPIAPL